MVCTYADEGEKTYWRKDDEDRTAGQKKDAGIGGDGSRSSAVTTPEEEEDWK